MRETDALAQLSRGPIDLVVLDVIARLDGIEVCARLRTLARQRAVLMIKARGAIRARLLRLDAVADDSSGRTPFIGPPGVRVGGLGWVAGWCWVLERCLAE